jgi:hypothetical protein
VNPSLKIVVTGLVGQYPLGGVAWDYLQYVVGLARLGHDVHYLEDTGQWPYNPEEGGISKGCELTIRHLEGLMARFGLGDQWAYRFPWGPRWFGMPDRRRREALAGADLIINVSGTLERPAEYREAAPRARLAYIDSDPVFTQVKLARGQEDFRRLVDLHDVHFSFGERLSDEVPATGHRWRPTRQPILLEEWRAANGNRDLASHRGSFTTVMNWTSYKPVSYGQWTLGQKDVELERFLDLPRMVEPTVLEVALAEGKTRRAPRALLAHRGFRIADPAVVCPDLDGYRDYVSGSKGEWSVAKNGYVRPLSGWFSCRSACYLAAGRPVVLEDTGYSRVIPTGEGLLAFASPEEAAEAIRAVESDYRRHSGAAREIAEEHFDHRKVLGRLVEEAMTAPDTRGIVEVAP